MTKDRVKEKGRLSDRGKIGETESGRGVLQ